MFSVGNPDVVQTLQQCLATFSRFSENIELRTKTKSSSNHSALRIRGLNASGSAELTVSFPSSLLLDLSESRVVVNSRALDIAFGIISVEPIALAHVTSTSTQGGSQQLQIWLESSNGEPRIFTLPLLSSAGSSLPRENVLFNVSCSVTMLYSTLGLCLPSCEELDLKFYSEELRVHAFRSSLREEGDVGAISDVRGGGIGRRGGRANRVDAPRADTRITLPMDKFTRVDVPQSWHAAMRLKELQLLLQLLESIQQGLPLRIALRQPGEIARFGAEHPTLGCRVECAFVTRACGNTDEREEYRAAFQQHRSNTRAISDESMSSRISSFTAPRATSQAASRGSSIASMRAASVGSLAETRNTAQEGIRDSARIMSSCGTSVGSANTPVAETGFEEALQAPATSPPVEIDLADLVTTHEVEGSQVVRPKGLFD